MPDIASLKLLGLAGVVSYAAARLAAKAGMVGYSRLTLIAVPVSGMPGLPKGYRIEAMTIEALSDHVIDISREVQQLRFAQGLTCLGAFNRKDALVGVTWVGSGPFREDAMPVRFHVPQDTGWDAGLWINPQYRLGRGFAALWSGTADWLRANGKTWSMSWIADYNLPSLLSHRRMGGVTVAQIMTFRFFRWHYVAEGRPRLVEIEGDRPAEIILPHPEVHRAFREQVA